MTEVESINGARNELHAVRSRGEQIGLVPTMGALHEGHLRLIRKMKERTPFVVVSVFVNPTQFSPTEDFSSYPRNREQDLELCRSAGANLVFFPDAAEMYPGEQVLRFEIDRLADYLCGKSRPGHFSGVLQVVNKLFNIIQPEVAVFGQKDIQQYILISRMVQEFNHPVQLMMAETVREPDGLAMSSRNIYLNKKQRQKAPLLYRALGNILKDVRENADRVTEQELQSALDDQVKMLNENGLKTDYLSVVKYDDLQPVTGITPGSRYIIAGAIYNGKTRLIDNIITDFRK
jgi:pantoate--beta-alanine ligase